MNNPRIALEKISSIILDWKQNEEMAPAYFAASKAIISDLNKFADEQELNSYAREKLTKLNWSIDAMFGSDIDNSHDFSQHLSWALGEIGTLKGNMCFGPFCD